VRKAPHLRRRLAGFVAAALWLAAQAAAQARPAAGNEFEWRFSLKANQVAPSNIVTRNICHKRNRFEIDTKQLPPFLRLLGVASFYADAHGEHKLPVQFDSTGLKAGEHEGLVVIKCLTCKQEGCNLDREVLHIYMRVEGEPAASGNFVPGRVLAVIPFDSTTGVDATAKKLAAANGLDVVETHPLESLNAAVIVFALREGNDVLGKVAALESQVLIAQPDFLYATFAGGTQEANPSTQLEYGRALIRADQLAGVLTGKGVKVALIDTALDANHAALRGKVVEQADMTGRGFTPDIHATLLAGIIASEPQKDVGISGIAPRSEILAIKACQPQAPEAAAAQCWSLTLARAMDFAIQKKARIIHFSIGGPKEPLMTRLIDQAVSSGIIVVAAAGNDGPHGQPSFPAALPNVIAVTAVDARQQLYRDATQGDFIDLAAPGVEILSTSPGSRLMVSSGTSLAAAFVSGAVALLLEQHPQLSPQSAQELLEHTAKDLGSPGKDPQFGSGLLDACRAAAELNGNPKLCR
jgi:subtilisin family serine protease